MKIVNIRVTDEMHALMKAVADTEFMPVSAYIRRHFSMRARDLGLIRDDTVPPTEPTTPHAPASATPKLDDLRLPDGSLDSRRLVVRMRTHARKGTTRSQFAREFGIGVDEMERACTDAANAGHDGSIEEWHARGRRDELRRLELDASYKQRQRSTTTDEDLFT